MEYRAKSQFTELRHIHPETDSRYEGQDTHADRMLKSVVIHGFYLCKVVQYVIAGEQFIHDLVDYFLNIFDIDGVRKTVPGHDLFDQRYRFVTGSLVNDIVDLDTFRQIIVQVYLGYPAFFKEIQVALFQFDALHQQYSPIRAEYRAGELCTDRH